MKIFLYLRSIFGSCVIIIITVIIGTTIILLNLIYTNRRVNDFLVRTWAICINRSFNIHVKVVGEENIPKDGGLYVFNHTSNYDIMSVAEALKPQPRFGAKTELFKIPIFGKGMRAIGTLEIKRSERNRVLELYKNSIESVYNGEIYILAAEGTRSPTPGVGEKLKSGPFIFAITGQFPVTPLVIKGAYECLPRRRLLACVEKWRYEIVLHVLPPVPTKGLTLDDRAEFQEKIRHIMTTAYEKS